MTGRLRKVIAGFTGKGTADWLLTFWELPQQVAGLLFSLFFLKHIHAVRQHGEATLIEVHYAGMKGGMALGRYVFLFSPHSPKLVSHEYGHTLQSKLAGWFYLPVIALPSLVRAALIRSGVLKVKSYDNFWIERDATRRGAEYFVRVRSKGMS